MIYIEDLILLEIGKVGIFLFQSEQYTRENVIILKYSINTQNKI